MEPPPPAKTLHAEHESIRQLLHALSGMAGAMREGRPVDPLDGVHVLEAVTGYADKWHHHKEESVLFPAIMDSRQAAFAKGLLPQLQRDHGLSRRFVIEMKANLPAACAGDHRAMAIFGHAAQQFHQLEENHIRREERELLPLAEALPLKSSRGVAKAFQKLEAKSKGAHERFVAIIKELAGKYARFAPPVASAAA